MIVKAKFKNKTYPMSKKRVCQKCMGERVIFVPNYKEYPGKTRIEKRDLGYWEPCKCVMK